MYTSLLPVATARIDMWGKFWKLFVSYPMNTASQFIERTLPKYRVEIERVTSTTHAVDASSEKEAIEKAYRAESVDSKANLAHKAVRTNVYQKNDADGYDLVTGLRGDA